MQQGTPDPEASLSWEHCESDNFKSHAVSDKVRHESCNPQSRRFIDGDPAADLDRVAKFGVISNPIGWETQIINPNKLILLDLRHIGIGCIEANAWRDQSR